MLSREKLTSYDLPLVDLCACIVLFIPFGSMSVSKLQLLLLIFFPLLSTAQHDTTIVLKNVEINSVRNAKDIAGFKEQHFDSITLATKRDLTVSELLNESSGAYLKNYGPGALSSISLRGGSAYHTSILWNGFPLANPMNGVMDLHLLPLFLFNDVSIQYGGAASIWGSGAISGAIHLDDNNTFNTKNSARVGVRYNDASGFISFGEIKYHFKNYSANLKYFQTNENNHFRYNYNGLTQKQEHAEYKGYGVILENTFLINQHSYVNLNLWHQYADRNIAPVLTELISNAVQRDNNIRLSLIYSNTGKRSRFIFRNAYFHEDLYYNDDGLRIPSASICKTFISEPEYAFQINNSHSVQAGINLTHVTAETADYTHPISLPREALYLAYKFSAKKIKASASARKEFSDLNAAPLTYSVGLEHSILKWLKYTGNFSTVYRNPQVNDLYWNPGGNIDLRSESGHSEELSFFINVLSLAGKKNSDSSALSLEFTLYNKNLDNRIAWTPHGVLWYPVNLKTVQSYGTESAICYSKKGKHLNWSGELNYAYTISENTSSVLANDESVNKQLIYVPIHKAGFNFKVNFKHTTLLLNHSFIGNRFTNTDNTAYLKSYQLASIQIDHTFLLGKVAISCMARVSNLLNESYNAVINRAEPLRNYTIGVSCQLN